MMKKFLAIFLFLPVLMTSPRAAAGTAVAQAGSPVIELIDRDNSPTTTITDGDRIDLQVRLPENAMDAVNFQFILEGSSAILDSCRIESGQSACRKGSSPAYGWYWSDSGEPLSTRTLVARPDDGGPDITAEIEIRPRPVVMVHGFLSSWIAFENYLGPDGYLALIGVPGFAVGDGQFEGAMNTGLITDPALRTNTIAENAAILGEYIDQVKAATGAEQIDLLAHSMGGLISRYYIDRVMEERDVAQLMMLGSPMAGTDCADLPAALRLYLPATLEIQPGYVNGIFNQQITHRNGIPFFALAGVPIVDPVASPCTATPTDMVVSRESVSAIPLQLEEMPVLHVDLNLSQGVFDAFVRPHLQTPPGLLRTDKDDSPPASAPEPLQFTRVYTGHVDAGGSQNLTIEIEPGLQVANFALYDTSRSLAVTVTGASGSVIELDPIKNGFTVLDDPAALFYLGYGFENPRPGPWQILLSATGATPPSGAEYAIRARYQGGAALLAKASNLLPRIGEEIRLIARLELADQAIEIEEAEATFRPLDGEEETLVLALANGAAEGTWAPEEPGLYAIAVRASGSLEDGSSFERVGYLTVEVQPETTPLRSYATVAGIIILICGTASAVLAGFVWLLRRRRK